RWRFYEYAKNVSTRSCVLPVLACTQQIEMQRWIERHRGAPLFPSLLLSRTVPRYRPRRCVRQFRRARQASRTRGCQSRPAATKQCREARDNQNERKRACHNRCDQLRPVFRANFHYDVLEYVSTLICNLTAPLSSLPSCTPLTTKNNLSRSSALINFAIGT